MEEKGEREVDNFGLSFPYVRESPVKRAKKRVCFFSESIFFVRLLAVSITIFAAGIKGLSCGGFSEQKWYIGFFSAISYEVQQKAFYFVIP